MRKKITLLLCLVASLLSLGQINTGNPAIPFGTNTSYDYGMMPTNLPTGGTYGASRHAADAYDAFKSTYVVNCGSNAARVKFDNTSETVSEGIAYTMLLAAYAADENTFDRLWQYYKNHRNGNGVMHWKINGCNTVVGQNGATDAELDAAMALIIADKQWGSSGQAHNYKNDAKALITAIAYKEVNLSDKTFLNGDAWGDNGGCRNPSYQAPAYARAFARFMTDNPNVPDDNQGPFWESVASATSNLLKNNANRTSSGLASNWSKVNGQPDNSCQGSGTAAFAFGYDACRAPWRQGTDYLWWGSASDLRGIVNKQTNFWIGKGGASQVQGGDGFDQSGTGNGDHNGAFTGMIGAQSLASTVNSTNQNYVNALYTANRNSEAPKYFTAILKVLGLFVQTGNFWNPYSPAISGGNSNPTVSLTTPSSDYSTCLGVNIPLSATANDSDGSISKVEFYNGSNLLFSDNSAPYSYTITNATAGVLNITAKAFDNEGATSVSSVRKITVSSSVSSDGVTCDDVVVSEDFHAAIDEFNQEDFVAVGATGDYGVFWFGDEGTYELNRSSSNMTVSVTNGSPTYKVFGISFGEDKTINLSDFSNADIKLDVTNNTNGNVYLEVQLTDINGNKAEIFYDNASDITWDNRWRKIGVEIPRNGRYNNTINLSSQPSVLGGYQAISYDNCNSGAVNCPEVGYTIDLTKVAEIIFIVNGGAGTPDNMNYTPVTGDLVFNYFSIGEISNSSSNIIEQGVVVTEPDADNDGVADASDVCPNTPSGQSVNAQGCAQSQLDSDNDGVNNDRDNCPNTPSGQSVNAQGCAQSQLDSDNDGVNNDRDDCPNSLPGETVDAVGCKVNAVQSAQSLGINIFPNPAENTLYINQKTVLMDRISLRTVSGVEVLFKSNLTSSEVLDLSNLNKGVYVVVLEGQNGTTQERIVVR